MVLHDTMSCGAMVVLSFFYVVKFLSCIIIKVQEKADGKVKVCKISKNVCPNHTTWKIRRLEMNIIDYRYEPPRLDLHSSQIQVFSFFAI